MNLKTLRAALAAFAFLCCGWVDAQAPDFNAMYCVDGKNMLSHCFESKQKAVEAITIGTLATHSANKWLVRRPPGLE